MAQTPENDRAHQRLDTQMLSDLWIFRAAASSGSITGAATQLNVTQSAVSQRVLRLESRLGAPLFLRDKSRIMLTDIGSVLYQAMDQVGLLLNDTLNNIKRSEQTAIVVSCAPSLATEWLVPHLEGFYSQHPGIEIFVRSEMGLFNSKQLVTEGIDLIISYQSSGLPDLHELAAIQEYVFPVCSRNYRDQLSLQGDLAVPVLLHDDMPWGSDGGGLTEWQAWQQASGRNWPLRQGGSRHFNVAQLAYHAAVVNQGVAIGRAVVVNRLLSKGELIATVDAPAVPGSTYRISATQSGDIRLPLRLFAAWWRDAMHETQQQTLALLGADG